MIDTHCHLYMDDYDADRDEVVSRAQVAGIRAIFMPNVSLATIEPMLATARRYPGYCFPMMGLHPEDVREDWQDVLAHMKELLYARDNPYIAVGEVGLDFYHDDTYREQQFLALREQLDWAVELDLPLAIHCRSAHNEMTALLREYERAGKHLRGVFHCFTGSAEMARELLRFSGFALGIGGVLTFKNSKLGDVVAQLPAERLVVETDAPWLAPTPHRGQRNEPAYVKEITQSLSEKRQATFEETSNVTYATSVDLFPKARLKK